MKPNRVKAAVLAGRSSLGTFVLEFNTTGIARLAAEAGAEFAIYDMEHTGWSLETVRMLMATSRAAEMIPLVRVPATEYHFMARVLDVGAMGLMVPMVENAEQARRIADACRYPPVGRRGAAFSMAHDDYAGGDIVAKMRTSNEQVLLIAQIETAGGLENVEAIAAIEGIDVLWIGHFDLTNALGIPGEFDHPKFHDAIRRVVAAARREKKAAGFLIGTSAEAGLRAKQGFNMLAFGGDLWVYQQALSQGIAASKREIQENAQAGR